MHLVIQPGKEQEWTLPLLFEPWNSLEGPISSELEERHVQGAIVQRLTRRAKLLSRGNPLVLHRIDDIFEQEKDINRRYSAVMNLLEEIPFYMPEETLQPEETTAHYLSLWIVAPNSFYVRPYNNGTLCDISFLAENKKPKLIARIWRELPAGYGIRVKNDFHDCPQFKYKDRSLPSKETFAVQVQADDTAHILKVIPVFAEGTDYYIAGIRSDEPKLARQAGFVDVYGTSIRDEHVPAYMKQYSVDIRTALAELGEMINQGVAEDKRVKPNLEQIATRAKTGMHTNRRLYLPPA